MGANLTPERDGATFRVWAPGAVAVFISGAFNEWQQREQDRLVRDAHGYWAGFVQGVKEGDHYNFYVVGQGSRGYKRDPYARDLSTDPPYPHCYCVIRDPTRYQWHDWGFRPPQFNDLVIYQLHIGTFSGPSRETRVAKFLDVLDRLDHLSNLGVNAIQPLPVSEYAAPRSMGYDGSDLFAPETSYYVPPEELDRYLARVNALLERRWLPPMSREQLEIPTHQLKALIDLCHVYGLAVILDVVYNHFGADSTDADEGLYFFDRAKRGNPNDSQYFTDQDNAGPVFAFWKSEVRQYLIDNAAYWIQEYHADGFRYDDASVIVASSGQGWRLCQDLTATVRGRAPHDIQIAEYWPVDPYAVRPSSQGGAGFDACWHDGLRRTIREALTRASTGSKVAVDLDALARCLSITGLPEAWKAVQFLESHDAVYCRPDRHPRIPALADPVDHWSWYARSRTRWATGLLLTAPGIPMLFMGQEFFEDKAWSDNPQFDHNNLIWWEGLEQGCKPLGDHLRYTRDLIALRRREPALRGEKILVFYVHNADRVLAFHRWVDEAQRDVVVVASLNDEPFMSYPLGFPAKGRWREELNSDAYDNWVNPNTVGNGGSVLVAGPALHGMAASAQIAIPANSILVFTQAE